MGLLCMLAGNEMLHSLTALLTRSHLGENLGINCKKRPSSQNGEIEMTLWVISSSVWLKVRLKGAGK